MTRLPRRGPWVALGSAAALVCLAWVIHPRVQSWRAMSRAEEELGALGACLLGSGAEPRHADDGQLRHQAIAASLAGDDWPGRCATHAAAAEIALGAAQREPSCHGEPQCEALAQMRGLLEN